MQVIIIKKVRKDYTNIKGVELVKRKSIKYYWYILKYKLLGYKVEVCEE